MIFVKNSRGGREVNMINTVSKINLSKIGWEGQPQFSLSCVVFVGFVILLVVLSLVAVVHVCPINLS